MQLFTDYLQPLTIWLNANPHWALLFTFLISFSESLAIIGSIIPGSVTMTAIGILAGSGIMRIDLTFLAAFLGAVGGDSISYTLGYTFRNRLLTIWPFSRYPNLLIYGKDYFARHGGKSVLIGRFIGPLRSMIPVIAGMLHMNRWHFLFANIISAIGWSLLYVMPGVLIGAASSELSAESATRLFVLILMLLVITWLVSIVIKWLLMRINLFLRTNLHRFWLWSKDYPRTALFFRVLTPTEETSHYPTAALIVLFLLSVILATLLTLFVIQGTWLAEINNFVYLFLQSVRTQLFDIFFIIISLFTKPVSLIALVLSITIYTVYHHDWRTLRYWMSLCFSSGAIAFLLAYFIEVPETEELLKQNIDLFYPAIELTFATTLFGFLIFYISTRYRTMVTLTIRVILLILLLLAGIASIYLGDNWLSSVLGAYLIGLIVCISHWIFYRRVSQAESRSQLPIVYSCMVVVLAIAIFYPFVFKKLINSHRTSFEQYVLTDKAWWGQTRPLLPLYTMNRIGQLTGLLNIQYVGSITTFQQALTNYGWKKQSSSFFYTLLLRAGGKNSDENLPLMAQLYLNRKPALIMTYTPTPGAPSLILRLWRSNYHLHNYTQPIWLGSINFHQQKHGVKPQKPVEPFMHLLHALTGFQFNRIMVPANELQPLKQQFLPTVLFIKESDVLPTLTP